MWSFQVSDDVAEEEKHVIDETVGRWLDLALSRDPTHDGEAAFRCVCVFLVACFLAGNASGVRLLCAGCVRCITYLKGSVSRLWWGWGWGRVSGWGDGGNGDWEAGDG